MQRFSFVLVGVIWSSALVAGAAAQPVLNRVEQLLRDQVDAAAQPTQPAEPGYLGLVADDAGNGVRVLEVVSGQAAQQAGLNKGDLISKINDQPIRVMDDMAAALAGKPAGAKLSITATRNGAEKQFDVTLGSRGAEPAAAPNALPAPAEPATPITTTAPTTTAPRPRLGVRSVPVTEAVQRQNNLASARGAQVVSVIVDSAAERAQIPLGAIITAVGEMKISNPQELAAAIAAVTSDDVELSYVYRGQSLRKKVELGATVAAGDRPNVQVRGRLPLPEDSAAPAAAPSDTSTPADVAQQELKLDGGHSAGEQGDLEQGDRIKTLERQVKQLEERIQSLESELTRQKAAQPAVPE